MACNSIAADIFIRTVFGYSFKDLNLLDEALDTTGTTRVGSNQSLALIGDSVLQAVIYRDWYSSGQPKGTGSQLLQSLSSNFNLAKVARNIGLDKHIVRHRSQASSAPSERTLATTLEAVLGAIDCDSGESADAVRSAMKMIGLSAEASKSISSTRQ